MRVKAGRERQLNKSLILGDPGADSGAEDENQNGLEKIRRAKVLFVFGPTICSWVSEDANPSAYPFCVIHVDSIFFIRSFRFPILIANRMN